MLISPAPYTPIRLVGTNLASNLSVPTAIGTAITTGASASTKGTAVQLISALAEDCYWISVGVYEYGAAATNAKACVDILGGAATEEILIADILAGRSGAVATDSAAGQIYHFPLYIPAGTRIAARCAGDRTSTAMRIVVWCYGGCGYPPWPVGTKCTTYGIGTVPAGTAVTGAYSETAPNLDQQITASTTERHMCVVPSFQPGADTTLTPAKTFQLNVGVGSATSELLGGAPQHHLFKYDTVERCGHQGPNLPIWCDVPASSRLVVALGATGGADAAAPEVALHCLS